MQKIFRIQNQNSNDQKTLFLDLRKLEFCNCAIFILKIVELLSFVNSILRTDLKIDCV